MRKPVITILFLLKILFVLTGCSQPIGSIYGGRTNSEKDSMFLVPRRILYEIDERFLRNEDFQIYVVENGITMEIQPTDPGITVALSGDHNLSTEFWDPVLTTHHQFFRVGRHIVNVEYNQKSANYSLQVTSPANGTGIGGDGGIGIIWIDPDNPGGTP